MSTTPPEPSPKDTGRLGARELARAKREAMARRAKRIRVWVAATTVSLFIAAFLVVYVQLASGHDPGLLASAERRAAASGNAASKGSAEEEVRESGSTGAAESSTGESSSSSESSSSGESSSSASEAESESSAPSELRTSQS